MLPTLRVKGVGTLKAMQLGQSVGTLPTLLEQCRKCSYTLPQLHGLQCSYTLYPQCRKHSYPLSWECISYHFFVFIGYSYSCEKWVQLAAPSVDSASVVHTKRACDMREGQRSKFKV